MSRQLTENERRVLTALADLLERSSGPIPTLARLLEASDAEVRVALQGLAGRHTGPVSTPSLSPTAAAGS